MGIYNDTVRDLLETEPSSKKHDVLLTDPNGDGCPAVLGVEPKEVSTIEEASAIVTRVSAERVTKCMKKNNESSRGHAVFMLYITGEHKGQKEPLKGFLCFADLAGSERTKTSGAKNLEFTEATWINRSLSALGNVFQNKSRGLDPVFRGCKLTELLQPCLSGDGKAFMFVHCSPDEDDQPETKLSLDFARRANVCCLSAGGPKRNVQPMGASSNSSSGAAPSAAVPKRNVQPMDAPSGSSSGARAKSRSARGGA